MINEPNNEKAMRGGKFIIKFIHSLISEINSSVSSPHPCIITFHVKYQTANILGMKLKSFSISAYTLCEHRLLERYNLKHMGIRAFVKRVGVLRKSKKKVWIHDNNTVFSPPHWLSM